MPSKQVTDRVKSAKAVLALIEEGTAKNLANALTAHVTPFLQDGERAPDYALMLQLLWRALSQKTTAMEKADQAHQDELSDDASLLKARDDAATLLSDLVVKLRGKLKTTFGADALPGMGFRGETPYDPTVLSAFAKEILSAIDKNAMPAPLDEDLRFDPTRSLDAIQKAQIALDATLAAVATDKRENQKTLNDKNKAMDEYDLGFSQIANFLVGAYQSVGMRDLAKKVRPSTRKPGQLIEDGEEEQ